ncbi:MAG: HD domain-containing protein [bacterium]|nr:HD domain-containing protein [bacterium]
MNKNNRKTPNSFHNKFLRDYKSLIDISQAMIGERNIEKLLRLIMEEITRVLEAERSSLFLVDHNTGEIWSHIAQKAEIEEIRLPIGKGIAGYTAKTGKLLNIRNAYKDKRFCSDFDMETGFRTKSVLCAAMFNHEKEVIGVIQVLNKKSGYFTKKDEKILVAFAAHASIALENAILHDEAEIFMRSLIKTLAAAVDARDPVTAGHSERVTYYALKIGEELKLNQDKMRMLEIAAILHDVGKIGVKDRILTKPGRYTKEEYEEMKKHAYYTKQILDNIHFSKKDKDIPLVASTHHEMMNGNGYPFGLKKAAIPLLSRIIAVADIYDAMISYDRPYKKAMTVNQALDVLRKESRTRLDRKIVDIFIKKKLYLFDRRNYIRINVELAIEYKVLRPEEQEKIYHSSSTTNISAGGLVFISKKIIPISSFVAVRVYLVDMTLDLTAKVIRVDKISDKKYKIAICFVNISDSVREKLSKYLVKILNTH